MGNEVSSDGGNVRDGYNLDECVKLFTEVFKSFMLEKQKAELEKMKHEIEEQQETINTQKHIVDSKETEITQLNKHITDLQTSLEASAKTNQQLTTLKDMYKTRAATLKETLEKEKAEFQYRIMQLMGEKVNLQKDLDKSLRANKHLVMKHEKEIIEKVEDATQETEERIKKVQAENEQLCDLSRLCSIKAAVVHGKVDHGHLNGKVLMVEKLEINGNKWFADGIEASSENAQFKSSVHNELIVKHIELSMLNGRVFYSNIKKLCLADLSISFDEYKEMVANIRCLSLQQITVKDENGFIIDAADLMEEVPNIETFEYEFNKKESIPNQKFSLLSPFPKLQHFNISKVNEHFDLKVFSEFMRNNPGVFYVISLRRCAKFYAKVESVRKDVIHPALQLKIIMP